MSRKGIIITDVLFVISLTLMAIGTSGFTKSVFDFFGMLVVCFATSAVMHLNYYKLSKKIY